MKLESKHLLWSMLQALQAVLKFVKDTSLEEYRSNPMMRAAVEREFITLGEALRRLEGSEPQVAQQIGDRAKIVTFRALARGTGNTVAMSWFTTTIASRTTPFGTPFRRM